MKCKQENCHNKAICGYIEGNSLYCLGHKLSDMMTIEKNENIIDIKPKCNYINCDKNGLFPTENEKIKYCSCHHIYGMNKN
jgi:hypothetical protein